MTSSIFIDMIRLMTIVKRILSEALTYNELFRTSTLDRKQRTRGIRKERLKATSAVDPNSWNFTFTSSPATSTTGQSHSGKIRFLERSNQLAKDIPCEVDCSCPDYKYRFAYANHQDDSAPIGQGSLNQCDNAPPNYTNPKQRNGMCKHLLSVVGELSRRLKTSPKSSIREKLDDVAQGFKDVDLDVD
jgi:hypothetical protein